MEKNDDLREACELKNVPKSGKSPEIKKSTIQNVGFLIRGGVGHIFIFSPNVNADYKCFPN